MEKNSVILDSPVILLCSERSGSNLIARIFDAHPDFCAPGASHLFKVMSECASRYKPNSKSLKDAIFNLFNVKVSRWVIDDWPKEKLIKVIEQQSTAAEAVSSIYAAEVAASQKRHVFIKENSCFAYLNFILSHTSNPKFLFFVRDPRDVAVSWTNGPVMRGGTIRATNRWLYDQKGYLETFSNLDPNFSKSFLRYEDLLSNPEDELKRVCKDLNIPFSDKMLSFSKNSIHAQTDAKRSSMWSNLNKPLISDNSNKFLKELNEDQITYIETLCADFMEPLGYKAVSDKKKPFGSASSFEELEAMLHLTEPCEKPAYMGLPQEERARFENWSRLVNEMKQRPFCSPLSSN